MTRARRFHICSICGGDILPGTDYYSRTSPPWQNRDKSFISFKAHHECREQSGYERAVVDDGFQYIDPYLDNTDCYDEDSWP